MSRAGPPRTRRARARELRMSQSHRYVGRSAEPERRGGGSGRWARRQTAARRAAEVTIEIARACAGARRRTGEDAAVEDVPARLEELEALPVEQHHQLHREGLPPRRAQRRLGRSVWHWLHVTALRLA